MATNVLLVGRLGDVLDDVRRQLDRPDVRFFAATGLEEARAALAGADMDHVIMGSGLDLEIRLAVIRLVVGAGDQTTVHMKDLASGPDGFLPFVRAVLTGLTGHAS